MSRRRHTPTLLPYSFRILSRVASAAAFPEPLDTVQKFFCKLNEVVGYPDVINFAEQNQPDSPESSNNVHYQTRFQPTDSARRATYQMLTSNLYRVFFWKLMGELQQDPWICDPSQQNLRMVRAQEFISQTETQQFNAANDANMFSTLTTLIQQAPVSCPALQ